MRTFLTQLPRYQKRIITLAFDTVCIWFSLVMAMYIRLGDFSWLIKDNPFISIYFALLVPLTALPFFIRMGLYRAVLRYINSIALLTIIKAVAFASITLIIFDRLLIPDTNLPRSVPFIYFLLLTCLMASSRFLIQRWLIGKRFGSVVNEIVRTQRSSLQSIGTPVLIYGSCDAIIALIKTLDVSRAYNPIAVIDIAGDSAGGEINGRPIFLETHVEEAIAQFAPEEILLAIPKASRAERQRIIHSLEPYGLPIKTMPSWDDMSAGRFKLADLQDVDINDVLGRAEVPPLPDLMSKCIEGKSVLVTGAGGSIGSEIARQIIRLAPARILILDHSEFCLYSVNNELATAIRKQSLDIELIPVLSSVLEQKRLTALIKRYGVNTVYHAAAYKHVPIVEHNMLQGLINNALGTVSIAQASIIAGVKDFVLISTDKAVRPTNIMGASKRLAEMALQALDEKKEITTFQSRFVWGSEKRQLANNTRFSMVRFGNVLGSSGSVVHVFKEQIRTGGPVTVTHPDVNRYFMSIPEAAQLVIQAGAMAKGGDVFVLDMGEPVKISALAEKLIHLSGLSVRDVHNPEGDIEIIYSGLRPGRKALRRVAHWRKSGCNRSCKDF